VGNVRLRKARMPLPVRGSVFASMTRAASSSRPATSSRRAPPRHGSAPLRAADWRRGEAAALRLDGEDRYRVDHAPSPPASHRDRVDHERRGARSRLRTGVGSARNMRLDFLGVETRRFPTRRSAQQRAQVRIPGADIRVSRERGPEILVPYYWNIAPNYDATITGRYMQKRGLQVIGEGRYLERTFNGRRICNTSPTIASWSRPMAGVVAARVPEPGAGGLGRDQLQPRSDDNYFRDLSGRLGSRRRSTSPGRVPDLREQLVGRRNLQCDGRVSRSRRCRTRKTRCRSRTTGSPRSCSRR